MQSQYPPDEKMNGGLTALMLITRYPKEYHCGLFLIQKGANVNAVCNKGLSPLAYCVKYNN